MHKYLIKTMFPKAEVLEIAIDRETEKSVFRNGRRMEKHTNRYAIFNSFHDAKNALHSYLQIQVNDLLKKANRLQALIDELERVDAPTKSDAKFF